MIVYLHLNNDDHSSNELIIILWLINLSLCQIEQAEVDDDGEEDVEEDAIGGPEDEVNFFEENGQADPTEISLSLDESGHQILHALVDPVAWKTELERVAPKLKAQLQLSTNEWRAHVDQTVTNNQRIESVLGETQNDLQIMNRWDA